MSTREFDVVVWGATGFAGRLVAEYLAERYGVGGELTWAIGGRSRERLEAVQEGLGAGAAGLPVVVGDSGDLASLEAMADRTRVVCTTVGPYAKYGTRLVEACVKLGTDYCDLTGEVPWIRRMIDRYHEAAVASGARIVPTCGFDSIPSDLGVLHLQREMAARHGVPARRVKLRVAKLRGGVSGGTAASLVGVLREAGRDREVRRVLADPYSLNPAGRRDGADGRDRLGAAHDEAFGQWIGPFVMAGINTRVVRRTHALLDDPYGTGFRYDEAVLTGRGAAGWARASALATAVAAVAVAGTIGPLRKLLQLTLPSPGEGPGRDERERGMFDLRLHGEHPDDPVRSLRTRVHGDRDPGYGSTARMLGESAVCLAKDDLPAAGGFWTPASAMGERLLERLPANAGVTFEVL